MSRFYLFLYGTLTPGLRKISEIAGAVSVISWFYFAFIHKRFFIRFMDGSLTLVDLLVGLPLVIALGVVIYATAVWLIKWLVILVAPQHVEPPGDDDDLAA